MVGVLNSANVRGYTGNDASLFVIQNPNCGGNIFLIAKEF